MNKEAKHWQEGLSVFDELDESWIESKKSNTPVVVRPLHERDGNIISEQQQQQQQQQLGNGEVKKSDRAPSVSSDTTESSAKTASTTTAKASSITTTNDEDAPISIRIGEGRKLGGNSFDVDDGDLRTLHAGPSSPSFRRASHLKESDAEISQEMTEIFDIPRGHGSGLEEEAPAPIIENSSSSDSAKEGDASVPLNVAAPTFAAQGEEDKFGSAREEQSISLAYTAADDVTCIEYSQVESLPDEAGPEWKKKAKQGKFAGKDLLNKPKSQLRTMFEGMYEAQQAAAAAAAAQVLADEEAAKDEKEDSIEDGKVDNETEEVKEKSFNRSEKSDSRESDAAWVDVDEQRQSASSNTREEERETDEMLVQVPQCTFTFSSPVQGKANANTSTPSKAHGLLRLLPAGAEKAEIEQILNTPRSERKSKDAFKLVSKLVEQERGERERKRVRVDHIPSRSSSPAFLSSSPRRLPARYANDTSTDYVRDAPEFMKRLRAIDSTSSVNSPKMSSLIINRKGAKAPTPESSLLRGRPVRTLAKGPSPRKILRLWSAANQVDEELEEEEKREREAREEGAEEGDDWQDVPEENSDERNRMRISQDAPVPIVSIDPPTQRGLEEIVSGAKGTAHRGMLHISPDDVDLIEMEKMANGKMTFDRAMGKWVPAKIKRQSTAEEVEYSEVVEGDSSDPFQDIESLASKSSLIKVTHSHAPRSQSALRNEVHLGDISGTSTNLSSSPIAHSDDSRQSNLLSAPKTPQPPMMNQHSPTPRSILKTGRSAMLTLDSRSPTTTRRPEGRSISFADGNGHVVSQQRVEKVEALLRQLAELALGPDDTSLEEDITPPRQDTPTRKLSFTPPSIGKPGIRSPWGLSLLRSRNGDDQMGNASFLTNASFNIARERILELITDVAPWEPGWQDLKQINLSKRRVDSLVRLKEFLPALEEAILDENEIVYLTGLPSTLRSLSLSNNRLPATVSFGHLINLEYLNISFNHLDESLMSLSQLIHLRHLQVEGNGIVSLEGIYNLAKLETLNLRSNRLQVINISSHQWPRLKDLILSHNQIVTIRGLSHLKSLRSLNLDHNNLSRLDLRPKMSRLKQLRLSGNQKLSSLDVGPALNLRTLYADDCSLKEVFNLDQLRNLDNLSLRQQNGKGDGINWPAHQTRDIKRLFLSGNAFKRIDLNNKANLGAAIQPSITKFYSMVYLELSACQLSSLPKGLSGLVPNLRHLNADYNLFESLPILGNLHRLKRLSIVGCRIGRSRKIVESLEGCNELNILDVRMNPCTMGLYPPILLHTNSVKGSSRLGKAYLPPIPHPDIARPDLLNKDILEGDNSHSMDGQIQQSFFHKRHPAPDLSVLPPIPHLEEERNNRERGGDGLFVTSDNRFHRTLPQQFRLQRLLHRGALAMACPNLTWLDGLLIDEEEVEQADRYFKSRIQSINHGQIQRSESSEECESSSGSTFGSLHS